MRYLVLLILPLFLIACSQHSTPSKNRFPVSNWIEDKASIYTQEQKEKLENISQSLNDYFGPQLVVYTMLQIPEGYTLESLGLEIGNSNRIGREEYDDGILILIIKNERKIRIELGKGSNKIISNETASIIIEEEIVPFFKQGDFYEGTKKAMKRISELMLKDIHLIKNQKK